MPSPLTRPLIENACTSIVPRLYNIAQRDTIFPRVIIQLLITSSESTQVIIVLLEDAIKDMEMALSALPAIQLLAEDMEMVPLAPLSIRKACIITALKSRSLDGHCKIT